MTSYAEMVHERKKAKPCTWSSGPWAWSCATAVSWAG
jgi:hypothetical protein